MSEENIDSMKADAFSILKLPEPEVLAGDPWHDDVLGRKKIAERLTNLISAQSVPFVVGIHGAWGTGKTFILKRWQKDLEDSNFKAIYFNAWDDDFCDDPLIAIIGQLSDYFEDSNFDESAGRIGAITNSIIRRSSLSASLGVVSWTTSLDNGQDDRDLLKDYLEQKGLSRTEKEQGNAERTLGGIVDQSSE